VKAKYAARIQEVPAFGPHVLSILAKHGEAWRSMAKHGEASKFEPRNIMKTLTKYQNIMKIHEIFRNCRGPTEAQVMCGLE
jgi:hypothetical protein